ncbi:MAG: trimeric intracellular cation channel family protein [Microthrixaceae bacterium]
MTQTRPAGDCTTAPLPNFRRVLVADQAATVLFALDGGAIGAAAGLDVFGVVVVACVSALGGGAIRDLLTGHVPPAAVHDLRYLTLSLLGGLVAIASYRTAFDVAWEPVVALDAAGLALFAVVGALMTLDRGLSVVSAALIGTITAVGGGVMRDIIINRVPVALNADVYATAALLAATMTAVGVSRGYRRSTVAVVAGLTCFTLRMTTHHFGWSLPTL